MNNQAPSWLWEDMITDLQIENFRGIKRLEISDCSLINVIVGGSGSGKTSLLEAIFIAQTTDPRRVLDLRIIRGGPNVFSGNAQTIVDSILRDIVKDGDFKNSSKVSLVGNASDSRSVTISRSSSVSISAGTDEEPNLVAPLFEWTDAKGEQRRGEVKVSSTGIEFKATGETVPNSWYFSAQSSAGAREAADNFTLLKRRGKHRQFIKAMQEIFPEIRDITVESEGGTSILEAKIAGARAALPLSSVSGSANRIAIVLLGIAFRDGGLVLVDEIENGVFYKNHRKVCDALIKFACNFKTQLFLTTHSQEWLEAFSKSIEKTFSDIRLIRLERSVVGRSGEIDARVFKGRTLHSAISTSTEVRGE